MVEILDESSLCEEVIRSMKEDGSLQKIMMEDMRDYVRNQVAESIRQ